MNDITLRLPLPKEDYITLIFAYALTLDADVEAKNQFYQLLSNIIVNIPPKDKLLLIGYLNARVGKNHRLWENFIGKESVENCSSI